MSLIAQALTTMDEARRHLSLYTYTAVTSTETLTADTASVTFSFTHADIGLNSIGTVKQVTTAGVTATLTSLQYTVDYDAGTLTFTAAMTGAITASNYDYYLWDYSKDNQIERLINSVSGMVAKYCNRKFIADTYSEFYKGSGRPKLVLNQYPINKITSVSVDSAALTAGTDYVTADSTYLEQGVIVKESGWTWYGYLTGLVGELTAPVDNIGVVYSAGYTLTPEASRNLPWDLEQAVLDMISTLYSEQQNGTGGLKQLTQGKLSYTFADNPLIQQHASTLDFHAKRVI